MKKILFAVLFVSSAALPVLAAQRNSPYTREVQVVASALSPLAPKVIPDKPAVAPISPEDVLHDSEALASVPNPKVPDSLTPVARTKPQNLRSTPSISQAKKALPAVHPNKLGYRSELYEEYLTIVSPEERKRLIAAEKPIKRKQTPISQQKVSAPPLSFETVKIKEESPKRASAQPSVPETAPLENTPKPVNKWAQRALPIGALQIARRSEEESTTIDLGSAEQEGATYNIRTKPVKWGEKTPLEGPFEIARKVEKEEDDILSEFLNKLLNPPLVAFSFGDELGNDADFFETDVLSHLGTSLEEEEAFAFVRGGHADFLHSLITPPPHSPEEDDALSFVRNGHADFLNSLSPPHSPKKKEVLPKTFSLRQPVLPSIPESEDEEYDSSSSQSSTNKETQKLQQTRRKRQGWNKPNAQNPINSTAIAAAG